jgi:hypothetical protein
MPSKTTTLTNAPHGSGGAPASRWLVTWLLALLLVITAVGSLEAYWRREGFLPGVPETNELWYFWRQQVYQPDGKVIVLLGTSRMNADISLATLHRCLPTYRTVQLAVPGPQSPLGVLRDLLADDRFTGVVICELETPMLERSHWNDQSQYRQYRPSAVLPWVEAVLGALRLSFMVACQPQMTLRAILTSDTQPAADRLALVRTFAREMEYDFSPVGESGAAAAGQDMEELFRRSHFPSVDSLRAEIQALDRMVQAFARRGGSVVFVRMPSSGAQLQLEERFNPRSSNWDRFAERTKAVCVHFRDIRGAANLRCGDGVHLDRRASPQFTYTLVAELQSRGVMQR